MIVSAEVFSRMKDDFYDRCTGDCDWCGDGEEIVNREPKIIIRIG